MNRYEVERAVQRAALPAPSKALVMALCTRINARHGEILAQHSPSLSALARMTGLAVSTVKHHLGALEAAGWVVRHRPTAWAAACMHETTRYELRVPFFYAEAGPSGGQGVGRQTAVPRPPDGQDAGRETAGARPPDGQEPGRQMATDREVPRSTESTEIVSDDLARVARDEMRAVAGRRITDELAAEIVRLVLDGRDVRDPGAYLRKAIRAEPARFLPTPGPPAFKELARLQREAVERSQDNHQKMGDT